MTNNSKAIITSASNKFFPSLLNFIGSIKKNYPDHPPIYIYNLGLNFIFKKHLEKIDGVNLLEIPKFVEHWRSCYTWKTYILNNPVEDLNFYLDAGNQVLKPLDEIFNKIDINGYLIVSAGNEVRNEDIIPKEYVNIFDISDNYLNQGIVTAGIVGFKKGDLRTKSLTQNIFDCGVSGLCLGFSINERWKNKGINKNYFTRNAKYFRHDNTLYSALIPKFIPNAVVESMNDFNIVKTNYPNQLVWNLRLNFKKLEYVFRSRSGANIFIKLICKLYIFIFLFLKEINRIIKKNKYE